MKNKLSRNRILDGGIRILLSVALISAMALISWYISARREQDEFEDLARTVRSTEANGTEPEGEAENVVVSDDVGEVPDGEAEDPDQAMIEALADLHKENGDLAGWVTVPGTRIDYPVMFTPQDPEHYLKRGFSGEVSGSGTPFMDYRTSLDPPSDHTIIYGHNRKDGSMFADLLRYRDREFYEAHPRMEFYTPAEKQVYEIFAVVRTEVYNNRMFDCYSLVDAENEEAFDTFFGKIKELSLYDTGVTVEYGDRVLTLSTCSYQSENGRTLVFGRYRP